jgi:hypothetical protein
MCAVERQMARVQLEQRGFYRVRVLAGGAASQTKNRLPPAAWGYAL